MGAQEPASKMQKERETKEDGRYIIYYTFEDETEEDAEDRED